METDFYKLTKKQLIDRLSEHGVYATTRARKATLVELLEEKEYRAWVSRIETKRTTSRRKPLLLLSAAGVAYIIIAWLLTT